MLQLQAKLIDDRPRYTLGTTSRILKNIDVTEQDRLEYYSKTNKSRFALGIPNNSHFNIRSKRIEVC